jgi:signal transduction histidine kinase
MPSGGLKHPIVAPVKMKEKELGILCVCNQSEKYGSDSERDLLCLMGNMAALEIQRKRMEKALAQSEEQLRLLSRRLLSAQEQERKRVARELHDGIGQSVTAIKFQVENVMRKTAMSVPPENLTPLNSLVTMIQEVVEEVGRISMDLRPSILDDLGILATITWLCKEFHRTRPDIRVEQALDIEEDWVPEDQKIVIFRLLQDALNNVAKHSRADLVRIGLCKQDARIVLTIQDNGAGFDWKSLYSADGVRRGLGLAGMKERTQLSGGILSVESQQGAGTSITASWPRG